MWFPTFATSRTTSTNSSSLPSSWHSLTNSGVSFDLYAVRSQIALSYAVNFHGQSNVGSSTVDMWTWTRWGRLLMTRMMLRSHLTQEQDLELSFVLPGAPASPAYQVSDSYGSSKVLNSLKPGEYDAELQWKLMDPNAFRGNATKWNIFKEQMDMFVGSRVFLRSVNSWNQAPKIESEHKLSGSEDVSMYFRETLSLIDFDSNDNEDVEITFEVRHGTMIYEDSISGGSSSSSSSRNLTRVGPANQIVNKVRYDPDSNWYVVFFSSPLPFPFSLTHIYIHIQQVRTRCHDHHHR